MRNYWPHLAFGLCLFAVIVLLGACYLTGPACTDYLEMDDTAQRKAALDWLVFTDMVDDRSELTSQTQTVVAQAFLAAQCRKQVQLDIPTTLNQFRP